MNTIELLREKSHWVRRETLRLHKIAAGTRIASSLSCVELLTTLYYGGILAFKADDPVWEQRDRLVASKGHGSVAMYPILSDLNFFDKGELETLGSSTSRLGVIPDGVVPGFETTNGALGHGPGVACGMALALRGKGVDKQVYVLVGDGEMNAGAVWEAVMFAGHHRLDNLTLLIDNNKKSMLGLQKEIMGLVPFETKFAAFQWHAVGVDGHDVTQLHQALTAFKNSRDGRPKVLIANTIKGKGVPELERDPICHVKSFTPDQVDHILGALA